MPLEFSDKIVTFERGKSALLKALSEGWRYCVRVSSDKIAVCVTPKKRRDCECMAFFQRLPQHPTKSNYMFQLFQVISLQEAMAHHTEQVGSRLI